MTSKIHQRHQARELALQALYQWDMTGDAAEEILTQFLSEQDMGEASKPYFQKLVYGVIEHQLELDEALKGVLDRRIDELSKVELAALRIAVFEFVHCWNVPFKVVINEAVLLTKSFGASDGYKYINGVLDRLALQLRALEIQAKNEL